MNSKFIKALEELVKQRNVTREEVLEILKKSLESTYAKKYGIDARAEIDKETGDISVHYTKEVVEEVMDDMSEIALWEAKEIGPSFEIGDLLEFETDPADLGRLAAIDLSNKIKQKLKEADRENTFDLFNKQKGKIVRGKITGYGDNGVIYMNIDNIEAIMKHRDQVKSEQHIYRNNKERDKYMNVLISDVVKSKPHDRGSRVNIYLSRASANFVKELFYKEIPEIQDGTVEIMGIAREAGSRTKIAVRSCDENVDPVGACVGNKGDRVERIVDEINGEKIDIIVWDEDPFTFIRNVLRPATVEAVYINEGEDAKSALAIVPESQLSLAIGRDGQNVRLAAKVSGWKIDIKSKKQLEESNFNFEDYEEDESGDNQE